MLPAGQGETVNAAELGAAQASGEPPASFTSQNGMYAGLVGAAPRLRSADLDRYFKPETFGPPAQPASEVSPRPGVRIARDAYNVPHVTGDTRADTMFGAGYATAQDRLFLMDVLRHTGRGRLTELIGPGTDDANVKADAEQLKIADYDEDELQAMIDRARQARRPGGRGHPGRPRRLRGGRQPVHLRGAQRPVQAARRVPRARQDARGLEGHRHRRDRLADRRHLRQGRRRRGEGRAGPAGGARALRRQARAQRLPRLPRLRRARGARHHDQALPLRPARPREGRGRRAARPRARSRTATRSSPRRRAAAWRGPADPRPARPPDRRAAVPARAVQRAARLAQAVQVRAPDRRHGPAGRLLLARDPDGDRPPRRRHRRPRRDVPRHQPLRADRARQGLRVEHHDRLLRQRRRVRREALPGRPALPLQGAVHPVRVARAHADRHARADRSGRHAAAHDQDGAPAQRARPDPGVRHGRRAAGRDRGGALDLPARDRLGRRLQAAELRRGRRARRRSSRRSGARTSPSTASTSTSATSPRSPPAGTRGGRRAPTRACPRGGPASGTGRGSTCSVQLDAAAEADRTRSAATSRTGTTSRRRAGGRPTTTGRSAPSSACSGCRSACARASRASAR